MFNSNDEGRITDKEINQQPSVWKKIIKDYKRKQDIFQRYIDSILEKHKSVSVIFTGAGTSAFVGNLLVPLLREKQKIEVFDFDAIPTTDLVAAPNQYFDQRKPTILVSFGRSGNSPESVAAVKLGKQIVKDLYQVVITCNSEGKLIEENRGDKNTFLFLLPDSSNDQGFAMTSSFTGMALAAYLLFSNENFDDTFKDRLIGSGEFLIHTVNDTIDSILTFDFDRIVYLGSGLLGQLTREAALKMLELTAGKTVPLYESSLGFRHGPKSIINHQTLVVSFVSQNEYTKQYDMDILRELKYESSDVKLVVLAPSKEEELKRLADWFVPVVSPSGRWMDDFQLAILYIIFAQKLALKKSIQLGINPDNPSPEGKVNRVVKGVTIYPWNG